MISKTLQDAATHDVTSGTDCVTTMILLTQQQERTALLMLATNTQVIARAAGFPYAGNTIPTEAYTGMKYSCPWVINYALVALLILQSRPQHKISNPQAHSIHVCYQQMFLFPPNSTPTHLLDQYTHTDQDYREIESGRIPGVFISHPHNHDTTSKASLCWGDSLHYQAQQHSYYTDMYNLSTT